MAIKNKSKGGRPLSDDRGVVVPASIGLPDLLWHDIETLAWYDGRSRSSMIKVLLDLGLEAYYNQTQIPLEEIAALREDYEKSR